MTAMITRRAKKAIGLDRKTTTLHEHHTFLYIAMSLHDYNVKLPHFTGFSVTVSIVPVAIRVAQAISAKKANRYKLISSSQIFQFHKGDQ